MNSKITQLIFLLISAIGFSQTPINSYFGSAGNIFDIVTPATPLDQTVIGANVTWTFGGLTADGQSIDTTITPTAAEVTTFPASTDVSNIDSTVGATTSNSKIYSKNVANTLSLTGFVSGDLNLNYITNNAKIGTFPLSYGYNFSDPTAGTFVSGTNSGTFTGTIVTKVDAWGTLNVADSGHGAYSGAVTRLKTVQNISLFYGIFGNVGTVVITNYAYFDASNVLQFRNSLIVANIPLLNINNQTIDQSEDFYSPVLSTVANELNNEFVVYPNPANDFLILKSNDNLPIKEISIADLNGRIVLKEISNFDKININLLESGVYLMAVNTNKGIVTKKILKE